MRRKIETSWIVVILINYFMRVLNNSWIITNFESYFRRLKKKVKWLKDSYFGTGVK